MGETPDDIRGEIENTRARMGDTVEAIGYKADVKSRMKESVSDKKDSLVGSVSGGKNAMVGKADALVARVGGIVPDASQVKDGAAKVGVSKENPLGLAVAGAAVGFRRGHASPEDGRGGREARPDLRRSDRQGQGSGARGPRPRQIRRPRRTRCSNRHGKRQCGAASGRDVLEPAGKGTGSTADNLGTHVGEGRGPTRLRAPLRCDQEPGGETRASYTFQEARSNASLLDTCPARGQ